MGGQLSYHVSMTQTVTETAPLEGFRVVGIVEKEIGINPGTPAARMVPGGTCWHCGTSIRICVQAKNTETGEIVDIGTTCAERIGLDKKELKRYLAERFAEQRYERSKAGREAAAAEYAAWESRQEAKFGPHGTQTRFQGGCSRGGWICDECRMVAPHGTAIRFWDGQCSCKPCVEAAIDNDSSLAIKNRPVLVSLATGLVVDEAKMISGQYGMSWLIPSRDIFVPMHRQRRQTVAKRGFTYGHADYVVRKGTRWSDGDWVVRRLTDPTTDDFGEIIPKAVAK